ISDNETLIKSTENVHYRVIEAGDFNYDWSLFEKNTIEEAEFIRTYERPPKKYELELMKFIGFVFEKFSLFNAFKVRYQNPVHLGYARRRLNGISVQRFDLNDFVYKLIKENDHFTAQNFEILVRQENQELLGGKLQSTGN
ncbi:Retrotransposon polyprotein, putative, partial [Candida maltosa Xu316]